MKHRKANTALANLMSARLACTLRENGYDTTKDPFPNVLGEFKYQVKLRKPPLIANFQAANDKWLMLMRAAGKQEPQPLGTWEEELASKP